MVPPEVSARRGSRWMTGPAVVGLGAGFLSGLFGVGGGILLVPGMVLLLKIEQRVAHGTSLAAIIPIALAGAVGYAAHVSVDLSAAALLVLGSAGGAMLGTALLDRIPLRVLRLAFAAIMVVAAVRLFAAPSTVHGSRSLSLGVALTLVGIGIGAGVLAGLLGVGGGILMVPALVLLLGTSDVLAKGTSLAVIIPTAVIGTAGNVRAGNADVPAAMVAGLTGAISALGGSVVAVRLDPTLSRALFALLLVLAAAQLLARPGERRARGRAAQ